MTKGIQVKTCGLSHDVLLFGNETIDSESSVLVLIHGNLSTNKFYEPIGEYLISQLNNKSGNDSNKWTIVAPTLRSFGDTEPIDDGDAIGIDATRGVSDWTDDILSILCSLSVVKIGGESLGKPCENGHKKLVRSLHVAGWSLGGGVAMDCFSGEKSHLSFDSLTLIASVSPMGFGGAEINGFAGSGGGAANPEFLGNLKSKDDSGNAEGPTSVKTIVDQFYKHPENSFKGMSAEGGSSSSFKEVEIDISTLLEEIFKTKFGDKFYPGDKCETAEWPGFTAGDNGVNNAISGKHFSKMAVDLAGNPDKNRGKRILWIRGSEDRIVSDSSFFDLAFLGKLGAVPGWPGDEKCPVQEMISQTRSVLEKFKDNGGDQVSEVVVDRAGHSPHLENPVFFCEKLADFLTK